MKISPINTTSFQGFKTDLTKEIIKQEIEKTSTEEGYNLNKKVLNQMTNSTWSNIEKLKSDFSNNDTMDVSVYIPSRSEAGRQYPEFAHKIYARISPGKAITNKKHPAEISNKTRNVYSTNLITYFDETMFKIYGQYESLLKEYSDLKLPKLKAEKKQ